MMSHSVLIRTMWELFVAKSPHVVLKRTTWELFVAKSPHVVSKRTTWENCEVTTMTTKTRRVTA